MWHEIVYSKQAGVDGIASHVYNLGVFFLKTVFVVMNALFLSSSPLAVLWGQLGGEGWLSSVPCFWIACHLRRGLWMWMIYFFRSLLPILLSSFAFIAVIFSSGKASFECATGAVSSKKYTCKPPIICEVFAPCLPSEMDPKCWWGSRVRSPMQTEP